MTDREISLPFRLDSMGRIATTDDPLETARQHLTSYLVTLPGERVMRPSFGTAIRDYVFELLDPLQMTLMMERVKNRVSADVPDVTLAQISASADDSAEAQLVLNVEFALRLGAGQGAMSSTTISVGEGA